jgi:Papain fold toxin 1, glutamine deamidase
VEAAGVGNPAGWIDAVNPHANARPGGRAHPWNTNCADCVRTYVTTRQGGPAIAASGDLDVNRGGDLMDDWLGVVPGESLRSDGILDLDTFPDRAWQYVADTLDGQPPDTVAVVTVAWEPIGVKGDTVLPGGHVFVAEVDAQNQVHWADPQSGDYRDWPPRYPQRPIAIEFVYRQKLDDPWQPGPPPR